MSWWNIVREILVIVAVLWVVDCLVPVRRGHLVLVRSGPRSPFRELGRGLGLEPLFPRGTVRRFHRPPLEVDPRGVWLARERDPEPADRFRRDAFHRIPWSKLRLEREHARLVLSGHRLDLPSPVFAAAWERRLEELRRDPSPERIASAGDRAFDPALLAERNAELEGLRGPLDLLSWVLLGWWVLVLPLAFFGIAPPVVAAPALGVGLLLWPLALFFVAGRFAELPEVDRRGVLLPLVLSPPGLFRAGIAVGRDFLHPIDPLLARARLEGAEALRTAARAELHGARWAREAEEAAVSAGGDPDADAWAHLWEERERRVLELVRSEGLDPTDLERPDRPLDADVSGWCPFCSGQYRGRERCDSCAAPLLPGPAAASG